MRQLISRRLFTTGLVTSVLAAPGLSMAADPYPNKPIRWLIPFAPGGATDTLARLIAPELAKELGQPLVIENRPGGNNLVASRVLIAAPADGYTIMAAGADALSIVPFLYDAPYKVDTDFSFISNLISAPYILVARPDFPAKDFRELMNVMRTQGEKINYASFGVGSVTHLATEMLLSQVGARMTMVPYPGGAAPAVQAILAGQVDLMLTDVPSSLQHIRAGKLRAYGWTGVGLKSVLPEVPKIAEAGLPSFFFDPYVGLIGMKGIAPDNLARLDASVKKVLSVESMRKELQDRGMVVNYQPGSGLREESLSMARQMKKVIDERKISIK